MSRFEKICWESSSIEMKVHGSINIPELTSPLSPYTSDPLSPQPPQVDVHTSLFSPTPSVDSGRSTSNVLGASPKYLIHGGPGFSLGLLDSTSGTTKHLPVPLPSSFFSLDTVTCDNFSLSEVLSAALAGDAQIWVGTESGSLHVFDLTPELRLSSHAFTKFPDPVSCIATRQPSVMDESLPVMNGSLIRGARTRTEVLVGSSNGNLTVIIGEVNERGGLRNPLKCPRKVIQLGGFEEGGSLCVSSIAPVTCSGVETYWCVCGASIVILRRSDWREMVRLDGCAGLPLLSDELSREIHISQLLATEVGVWSSTSHSSTLVLWDTQTFSTKMKITCHDHCTTQGSLVDDFAQITALSFSYPLLFVGTRGGHLLSFRIQEDLTASPTRVLNSTPLLTHRIAAATYCSAGNRPIVSIHSTPVPGSLCPSPLPPTPAPTMHVLVVLGHSEENRESSPTNTSGGGLAQLYELSGSPRPSPITSPFNSVLLGGVSPTTSSPVSFSFPSSRRDSLANLAEPGSSLPKLSLVSVHRQTSSYLPLRDSD